MQTLLGCEDIWHLVSPERVFERQVHKWLFFNSIVIYANFLFQGWCFACLVFIYYLCCLRLSNEVAWLISPLECNKSLLTMQFHLHFWLCWWFSLVLSSGCSSQGGCWPGTFASLVTNCARHQKHLPLLRKVTEWQSKGLLLYRQ